MKSTAPVLKENGTKITKRLYELLFANHPYVNDYFNKSHVFTHDGGVSRQAMAQANAIFAYASYCDNLSMLNDAVAIIAHKHVSFAVPAEYYEDVGTELLQAIKDVLGNAATSQVMNAWQEGYDFLADLLIDIEYKMRKENIKKKGGWMNYKTFEVKRKERESDYITSFYLQPVDNQPVPDFQAGQYLSFSVPRGQIFGINHDVVRNYSLSCQPGLNYFRISVKRELSTDDLSPHGLVSNHFHDNVTVGSELRVGMPCGTFVLKTEPNDRPIVLIGGGVGLTPMMSMLETVTGKPADHRQVVYIHCVKGPGDHAMAERVDTLANPLVNSKLTSHVFYSRTGKTQPKFNNTKVHDGRLTAAQLKEIVPSPVQGNEYYYCGPGPFMKSVGEMLEKLDIPKNQTNFEHFGPQLQ